MKNVNKQQMLMDFSCDQSNDVHRQNYTLGQAANMLCISSGSVFWLIHKRMLDAILEEGRMFIVYDSLHDYMQLEKVIHNGFKYDEAFHNRINAHFFHLRNNSNAADVSIESAMTLQCKHRKWVDNLDVPEINFYGLAKELNIVDIPRKKLEAYFKILFVQYDNEIDYTEYLESVILDIQDAINNDSDPQPIIQDVVDGGLFNVQKRPPHQMVFNQHLYPDRLEPSEEISEFHNNELPVDLRDSRKKLNPASHFKGVQKVSTSVHFE